MAISILAQDVVSFGSSTLSDFTESGFTVPGGTSCLLVGVTWRGFGSGSAPNLSTATWNGDALTRAFTNATGGFNAPNSWWGYLRSPDIGNFDLDLTFPSACRGGPIWILAISGEKASGSPFGTTWAEQHMASAVTDTVGLGLTPAASGDSALLATLAISLEPSTLISWTGTGFVTAETGTYSASNIITATLRYKLNAAGTTTVQARFAVSTNDIGGSLVEILAEPTGTDVGGDFDVSVEFTGSVAGPGSARIADASFRNGLTRWTEIVAVDPDSVGVNRRLITAGPTSAPNLTVDQIAAGIEASNVWRWRYRLADGQVTVESEAGSQSTTGKVIGLVHSPGDPTLYISGVPSVSSITNGVLTGALDLGSGGQAIAGHDGASPAPFTGLFGRYLLYDGTMSEAQMRLLAMSLEDPNSLWAYGEEDAAADSNRSPLAFPLVIALNGQSEVTVIPKIVDPGGGSLEISSVTQPANGTLTITSETRLTYRPNPGWQGSDAATYTVSDGSKSSTAEVHIIQSRPALKVNGDNITVSAGQSVIFDPRANDVGAGTLRTISVTQPTLGTVQLLSDGRIRYTAPS